FPLAEGDVYLYWDASYRSKWAKIPFHDSVVDFDELRRCDGRKGFGDKASAIRYKTPSNWRIRLFDDDHYRERTRQFSGTGSTATTAARYALSAELVSSRVVTSMTTSMMKRRP